MADKRVSIVFDAKMEVGNIKTALEEINKITSNAAVNLPKGISSNLTKTIQSIRSELLKLEGLQGAEPSAKNANSVNKAYTNIVAKFQSLKALMGDLNKDFALDPKKFFSPDVENQIKGATQALEAYYKKLKEGPQGDQYKKDIENLNRARRDQRTAQNRQSQADLDKKETEALIQTLEKQAKAEESAAKAAKKTADEQVKKAVDAGIRKINFGTDVCYAFIEGFKALDPFAKPLDVTMSTVSGDVKAFAIEKIKLLGADKGI